MRNRAFLLLVPSVHQFQKLRHLSLDKFALKFKVGLKITISYLSFRPYQYFLGEDR